ncbi:MAG: PKD domain-containing protein, partial [Sedimentisphaerales bacterium]|nr:PKD domain-containing protein [Sedimentisphaerales bacterium]
NLLAVVYLTPGSYTVELSDAANGRVCADALVVNPLGNPQKILTSEFRGTPQSGAMPLTANFTSLASSYSLSSALGGIKTYHWDFGDGTFSNLPQPSHTYNAAGKYTVSLTVSDDPNDPNASVTETKTNFITVGQTPELRAEFTAPSRFGPDKTNVYFEDQSTGDITSWHWDFGDGTTSDQRSPLHVYAIPGPYTVSLTVSGADGNSTETETAFVYNLIGLIFTDNTFIEKPHYYSRSGAIVFGKLICDTGGTKIPNEDMKYARLFMGSCNSANYFTGAFNRGIYFCTTADIYEYTAKDYLKDYLYRGWSDAAILQHMNEINPGHDYVNFNLKPPSMR